MIKKLIFIIALVTYAGTCFAQSDYLEGYIITLSKDTIHGLINYKSSVGNLKQCRFKPSPDAAYTDYTPEEISAFSIIGKKYYTALEVDIGGTKDSFFIETLVEGIVDVFLYREFNQGYYLIRTDKGELYELQNSKVEVETEEGRYTKEKKEYVRMLRYLFSDSPSTLKKVDQLPFKTNAMIDIAQQYHEDVCDEYECVVYTKEKKAIAFTLGLYAGYSLSNLSLKSEHISKMNNDFSSSADPFFGLFLNIMDPNISERFSIQLDCIFQRGKYIFDSTYFTTSYVRVPFSIKYTYPGKKIKPSFQLGIAYNKWYNHSSQYIIPAWVVGDVIQKRDYQYGLFMGIEVSYELSRSLELFAQGRYEKYSGKSLNIYTIPEATPPILPRQEYVDTKTDFISASVGLKF